MKHYYEIIEQGLQVVGVEPENARNADEGQWSIFRGEVEIFIDIWDSGKEEQWNYYFEEKNIPVLQVISPITTLPVFDLDEFYEELLSLNRHLFLASFVVNKEENMLAVKFRRAAIDLTVDDVVQAVESTGYYAEFFQPRFMHKYNVKAV